MEAFEQRDTEGMAALLSEDARMTMPPMPSWYDGREAIAAFFAAPGVLAARPGHGADHRDRRQPPAGASPSTTAGQASPCTGRTPFACSASSAA